MRLIHRCLTCLCVLVATVLADPCVPLGTTGLTGRNCAASTFPIAHSSEGTRFVATANIAYCASADNYLYSDTRYNLDSATLADNGDQFEYSIWWDQPDTHCLLDVVDFVNSNFLRNTPNTDANGFTNHPRLDISQYAYRKWYTRRFTLPNYNSQPISVTVSCDTPDTSIGDKKFFFKGVNAGNLKKMLADETQACGTSTPCNPLCATNSGLCDFEDQTCKCSLGWTDAICATPICRAGCANGGCTQPDQCDCQSGWQGTLCDTAICSAGCLNGGCTQPNQCNCQSGWTGALCEQAVCASSCDTTGGYCTTPNTCLCRKSYSGINCDNYCKGEQPLAGAECQTINGTSVWVYNGTLVVVTPIAVDVLVLGDLVIQSTLVVSDGAVISVAGCPVITSSLLLTLSPEEIELLLETGVLNRTVLMYNAACSTNDFTSVEITSPEELKCFVITNSPQKSPGQITLLVSAVQGTCKTDTTTTPATLPPLPDWAIALIVVVPVVAAGVGLTIGLVRRQRQYDKALANIQG